MEVSKIYETVALQRIRSFEEIQRALSIVEAFIKKNDLVLYGGMAIDFALKAAGSEGIYPEESIPDYDFFSRDSFSSAFDLARVLYLKKFEKTSVIPAIFPSTVRVRIDKVHFVADCSYKSEPYFTLIPKQRYKSFLIVHPDFQRIDLHRSLSMLYEGAPRENFKNRLSKDIARLKLFEKYCPVSDPKFPKKKIVWSDNFLLHHFQTKLGAGNNNNNSNHEESALAGESAFAAYLEIIKQLCQEKKLEAPKLENADFIESYPERFLIRSHKAAQFSECYDVFPQSFIESNTVYYLNNSSKISASDLSRLNKELGEKFGTVLNIHNTMQNFLFKAFMLQEARYISLYKDCVSMIAWAEAHFHEDKKAINLLPFFVNGTFFGNANYNAASMLFFEKIEALKHKTPLKDKPIVKFDPAKENPKIDYSEFLAYKITGEKL